MKWWKRSECVVRRENMGDEDYVRCFRYEDQHQLWQGVMELLHRMEGAQVDDPGLTNDQKVAGLKLLNEIRAQMVVNRKRAEKQKG